jgi:hypothetical protein
MSVRVQTSNSIHQETYKKLASRQIVRSRSFTAILCLNSLIDLVRRAEPAEQLCKLGSASSENNELYNGQHNEMN